MADSSKESGKETSKETKDKGDLLLPDSDCTQDELECDIRGVILTDAKSYESHLQGKKHQKKSSEAKFFAKHLAAENKEDDSDEDEDSKDIHCEVCNKNISGYRSYIDHLKGSVHSKSVRKQKLKDQMKDMPGVLDREDKESGPEDDDCLSKPYARCTVCEKTFSGPEPFRQHMKSGAHKKKLKSSQILQNLKVKYDDASKTSDDEEFFRKCDDCQKSFSGHIPYQIHMTSKSHKKTLEKKKIAEDMKQLCLNEDTTAGYVCKDCKWTFIDPSAFKWHLENNSHEKQKAKKALVWFLASNRDIVFVTPVVYKAGSGESDEEDSSSQYYLICKLCNMSFTGPESAQDHVKSKKHINAKTEKKRLKILKEQNISSPAQPRDKSGAAEDPKTPANGHLVNDKVKDPEKSDNHHGFEML